MWQIYTHQLVGGNCSVCRDTHYVVSESLMVSVLTGMCKLSVENHFRGLDANGNLPLDIGLKELFHQMLVYTGLRWVVFGCCGVVL